MSSHSPKGIIDGFEEDFCAIVERFSSFSSTLEFKDFLEFWKNEYLDCLFANRFDPRELVEAIIHMNAVLTDKFTSIALDDQPRIVALYFIFCLYSKQPSHLRRKVRLTVRDAVAIQNMLKNKEEVQYRNARFIWKQLRAEHIIQLVEERRIFGPSVLKKHGGNLQLDQSSSQDSIDNITEFFMDHISSHLSELESMMGTYQELKRRLELEGISDPTVEINSAGTLTEFISQARDMLANFRSSSA